MCVCVCVHACMLAFVFFQFVLFCGYAIFLFFFKIQCVLDDALFAIVVVVPVWLLSLLLMLLLRITGLVHSAMFEPYEIGLGAVFIH